MYVGWQNVSAEALKGCYNPFPNLKDDILNDMKSTSSANDIPRPSSPLLIGLLFPPLGSPLGTDTIFVDTPESHIYFIQISKTFYRFHSQVKDLVLCYLVFCFQNCSDLL